QISIQHTSLTHPYTTVCYSFFFYCYGAHRDLHSFPTRRSSDLLSYLARVLCGPSLRARAHVGVEGVGDAAHALDIHGVGRHAHRSEEHTSELQSLRHLVCRLLLEKKKKIEMSYTC